MKLLPHWNTIFGKTEIYVPGRWSFIFWFQNKLPLIPFGGKKSTCVASEMTQKMKAPSASPDDLGSITRSPMAEG